jgi:hypothetical protein
MLVICNDTTKMFGTTIKKVKVKVKPEGFSRLRLPDLRQSAHEGGKVVSPTHRPPLPPGNIPDTHFCYRLSRPQGNSATGRITSMEKSSDIFGNRTRDLQVCSAVPQPLRHRVPPYQEGIGQIDISSAL